ncbi:hypothetical protein FRB95_002696 [Tulasnella sp. JGI-2019a]|nr:hypothetical protein FRB95_002696 [Tulasnella sp. JGI-2019a]
MEQQPLNNTSLSHLVHQYSDLSIIMSVPEFTPYVPATGIYLFKNASGETMMDLINGGDTEPKNVIKSYARVTNTGFRNQYWYTVDAHDQNEAGAFHIVNIRTGTYLHTDGDEGEYSLTVKPKASEVTQQKRQLWYFYEAADKFCKIQNVYAKGDNDITGFLTLAEQSQENYVPIRVSSLNEEDTQLWLLNNRARTGAEIQKMAEHIPLLKDAKSLLPTLPYLQMPNPMYITICKEAKAKGDILDPNHARFDQQQIFAFKEAVDMWANASLKADKFFVLTGLAFGEKNGSPQTSVWGLEDQSLDELKDIAFFDILKASFSADAPTFAPKSVFF